MRMELTGTDDFPSARSSARRLIRNVRLTLHVMRAKRLALWIGGAFAVFLGLALCYYLFILDWQGRPFCHKQLMFGFLDVMHPSGGDLTNAKEPFPNVKGLS